MQQSSFRALQLAVDLSEIQGRRASFLRAIPLAKAENNAGRYAALSRCLRILDVWESEIVAERVAMVSL